ncbi:glycoside hydrolase family 97 catalytic domain-containing protein [Micromonospora sp. WMMD961]|uniref:glycoside hydrolase family 97 catalytic domain-containing protein n=1 Tax=Micromonospora sp. WMMD961 TaxID=3016100 RepID=UPI0024168847|nr:glycoside hydrolase family 97 catalytic domain-containing protein [Micromonospora sp. WMMD961]MDG4782079.1 glycoside hydrolase family 97 catalytic domain-containing protein [Micromonospora sp. WMMD961]
MTAALAVSTGLLGAPARAAEPVAATLNAGQTVRSPDGTVGVAVSDDGGRLSYSVTNRGKVVVGASGLGLDLAGRPSLTEAMSVVSVRRRTIDETWKPLWGTDGTVRNHARELTVHAVQAGTGFRLDVVVRVFDNGVGIRYHIPAQPGVDDYTVTAEHTEFTLDPAARSWSIAAGKDWNADEQHYRDQPLSAVPTAQTPITVAAGKTYLVVHEADLTDYPSMTLKAVPGQPGRFSSDLISLPDGTKAKLRGDFSTPWRTLTIGERPGDLAESHLIENLNDPCAICADDTSWIKPASYVGVWWELQRRQTTWTYGPTHGATTARLRQYVDLAKQAGAKFVLAEGWNTNAGGNWANQDFLTPQPDFDLPAVLDYAEQNGVEFIAHNETRGDVDYYDQHLEEIFSRYEELGIHAIKTGYATKFLLGGVNRSHFDQEAVRHYQRVIDTAARHRITINAHESIKPTGLARTYPNMMSGEGVAGMEQQNYKGANGNPPAQATILPFTRFMGGPADYTPGVLNVTWDPAKLGTRVQTTSTAQLALSTIFYSPLQMLADTPENYAAHPGFAYLKDLPTSWDESRVLDSAIGDYTTTARRHGDTWYVGAITDENDRTLPVPLSFLSRGSYVAEIYADAAETTWRTNPLPVEISRVLVRPSTELSMSLVAGGGQAIRIRPASEEDLRDLDWYAAPRARFGVAEATLDAATQRLTVTAPLTNAGSTVSALPAQVFVDGRAVGDTRTVRVAGTASTTVELTLPATQVPDQDFRVAVGAPTGAHGKQVRVPQTRSVQKLLQQLHRSGDVTQSALGTLQQRATQAESELSSGDVTGRLRALQNLRLDLYRQPVAEVTVTARTAIDDLLTVRLGPPRGLLAIARNVRLAADDQTIAPALARQLVAEIASAARSASANDTAAVRTALDQFEALVTAAAATQIDPEVAATLLASTAALTAGPSTLQAEAAQLLGEACLRTNHAGYTGTGFVACLKTQNSGVRFTAAVTGDGDYLVRVRYGNAMGATQTMTLRSGTASTQIAMPTLPTWPTWSEQTVKLPIARGDSVDLVFGPTDNGNVNVDAITLEPDLGVVRTS